MYIYIYQQLYILAHTLSREALQYIFIHIFFSLYIFFIRICILKPCIPKLHFDYEEQNNIKIKRGKIYTWIIKVSIYIIKLLLSFQRLWGSEGSDLSPGGVRGDEGKVGVRKKGETDRPSRNWGCITGN